MILLRFVGWAVKPNVFWDVGDIWDVGLNSPTYAVSRED